MNKDFSKYQKIIDDFTGQVSRSDFENRFTAMTKHVPKTERFLLKMELKRLASPCTRLIDLRGHVDGKCKAFEHEERTHYLDEVAKKVFTKAFDKYGKYTFGVYEATMNTENNFRVIYQKEKTALAQAQNAPEITKSQEITQYPATFINFGPYHNRLEERMNYAIAIDVSIDGQSPIESISSDISINGIKLRISGASTLSVGQVISLRFKGLETEFQFEKDSGFSYEIRNIINIDNLQLIGAKRLYDKDQRQDGFRQFLQGYIQGNKRRYKINLDNTISALQARSLEQFILPKSSELPVFMQLEGKSLIPKFALTCNNNQETYQYWQDEKRFSTLYCLLTPERIERLKAARNKGKTLLVFSFIHKNQDKVYFYSADEMQLATEPDFIQSFLGFSAAKPSFAVTRLSLIDVDAKLADSGLTLSESLTKKNQYLNAPVPEDVKTQLKSTAYLVVISSITHADQLSTYQSFSFEGINTTQLKKYGHKRLSRAFSVDEVGINYRNQRQELRFKYKTPTSIEIDGVQWLGKSHDFSTLGLKIELEKSSVLVKGDIVSITFPELQKITSAFELKNLPYEVMRINKAKTIVNLRVVVEKHQHIGRKFFKALIEKNRDKLTTDEYAMATPGLSKALRNIYSASCNIPSLVVKTSGSRYKVDTIACGDYKSAFLDAMKDLSEREAFFNLYPLLGHPQSMSYITDNLKKMQVTDTPKTALLYISIKDKANSIDKKVSTKFDTELTSDMARKMFIRKALKEGLFFCILTKLSRAAEPDMDYLNPELSYVGSYAIHRGKQLEQEIWSVTGIIELIDVTQEALYRHQLMA